MHTLIYSWDILEIEIITRKLIWKNVETYLLSYKQFERKE